MRVKTPVIRVINVTVPYNRWISYSGRASEVGIGPIEILNYRLALRLNTIPT